MIGDALRAFKKRRRGCRVLLSGTYHLVGSTEHETLQMQVGAITAWKNKILLFLTTNIFMNPGFATSPVG